MYDFETEYDRSTTDAEKWHGLKDLHSTKWPNVIPMWVADNDYACPSCVTEALKKRLEQPVFGYSTEATELFCAFKNWMEKRHGVNIETSWITFSPGIVPAIGNAIRAFSEKGDKVVAITPVYHPFKNMIIANNRTFVESPAIYKDGKYFIDFDGFDKACEGAKLVIFCNPHNPLGRVWSKEEMQKVAEIVKRHKIILFSDEIHGDLVYKPLKTNSALGLDAELDEFLVAAWAPSKTFNIAGLQASCIVIPNEKLRNTYRSQTQACANSSCNCLASVASVAAYKDGEKWLDECLDLLQSNYNMLVNTCSKTKFKVMPLEGTYLAWIDFRNAGLIGDIKNEVIEKAGIRLDPGIKFGEAGSGFGRLNIGCSKKVMSEACHRLLEWSKEL